MNQNGADTGESSVACPSVTPQMVRARTVELAIHAGRSSIEIRQCDYERAKRELTGETDPERQQEMLYGQSW
jgi:hypothetical protein